jgi:hypothetical protein
VTREVREGQLNGISPGGGLAEYDDQPFCCAVIHPAIADTVRPRESFSPASVLPLHMEIERLRRALALTLEVQPSSAGSTYRIRSRNLDFESGIGHLLPLAAAPALSYGICPASGTSLHGSASDSDKTACARNPSASCPSGRLLKVAGQFWQSHPGHLPSLERC